LIIRPLFSFYGAKFRASKYYPQPKYNKIIEPFAGSGCYSLRYWKNHDVLLNEIDPVIYELWRLLINISSHTVLHLPDEISDLYEKDPMRSLIGFWYNKGQVKPTTTKCKWMVGKDSKGRNWKDQFWGDRVRKRIANNLHAIRRFQITNKDYSELENEEATWFIDPPYKKKGTHYIYNEIDYDHLGKWCLERKGQIIVCEQEGADWLDFKPFRKLRALKKEYSNEVCYGRENSQRIN